MYKCIFLQDVGSRVAMSEVIFNSLISCELKDGEVFMNDLNMSYLFGIEI